MAHSRLPYHLNHHLLLPQGYPDCGGDRPDDYRLCIPASRSGGSCFKLWPELSLLPPPYLCDVHMRMQVPGLLPLHLAAFKALTSQVRGKLQSKSLHAELVFSISGSKHVGRGGKHEQLFSLYYYFYCRMLYRYTVFLVN